MTDDRVADFFEPVTLAWDPAIEAARQAAKEYSQQTTPEYD